jgi:hypothetical protein
MVDCAGPLEALSFRELVHLVEGLAQYLTNAGITANSRVCVQNSDNAIYVLIVLALDLLSVREIHLSGAGGLKLAAEGYDCQISDEGHPVAGVQQVIVDAQRIRALAIKNAGFERSESEVSPIVIFRSGGEGGQTSSIALQMLVSRMTARLLPKQSTRCSGWVCVADVRTEIGLSCVLGALAEGQAVGLSSGTMDGDIQLSDLYQLDGVFIAASQLLGYARHASGIRALRYRPAHAVVAGSHIRHQDIANSIGAFASHIIAVLDLPETGAVGVALYRPALGDLQFSSIPPAAITVVSEAWEPHSLNQPGRLAVLAPNTFCNASGASARNGWYMSGLTAQIDSDHYIRLG